MLRNILAAMLILAGAYAVEPVFGTKDRPATAAGPEVQLIPVVSKEELLSMIGEGKRVVFVDAREPAEFEEEHIPGAINLTVRDINELTPELIGEADLVIGYCLKDFRGYEVAKALHNVGVENVRTIATPGLNGWKAQRLPIYSASGLTDDQAVAKLMECAKAKGHCKENES